MSDIRKTLPPSVGKSVGIGTMLDACGSEVQQVEDEARAACRRSAVSTADEAGAMLWEQELGLDLREDLPIDARRALIFAALEELNGCSPERLRAFIGRLMSGTVTLREDFPRYRVGITVQAEQFRVPRVSQVERAIRRILPAHLESSLTVRAAVPTGLTPERALTQSIRLDIYTAEEEAA